MTPFGLARGAARVHDDPDVLCRPLRRRLFRACGSEGVLVGDEAVVVGVVDGEGDVLRHRGEVLLHPVGHLDPRELLAVLPSVPPWTRKTLHSLWLMLYSISGAESRNMMGTTMKPPFAAAA